MFSLLNKKRCYKIALANKKLSSELNNLEKTNNISKDQLQKMKFDYRKEIP